MNFTNLQVLLLKLSYMSLGVRMRKVTMASTSPIIAHFTEWIKCLTVFPFNEMQNLK